MYFLLEQCLFEYKIELFVSQIFLLFLLFTNKSRKEVLKEDAENKQ